MKDLRIVAGPPPATAQRLLSRRYPARLDLKPAIIDAVITTLTSLRLVGDEDRAWVALCVDEAVVNAILHGNEGDPGSTIEIAVGLDPGRWVVDVSDLGGGFSAEQVPDPDDPATLLLEHGRGIRIMREWLDELTFYRGGATARLARACVPPSAPDGATTGDGANAGGRGSVEPL